MQTCECAGSSADFFDPGALPPVGGTELGLGSFAGPGAPLVPGPDGNLIQDPSFVAPDPFGAAPVEGFIDPGANFVGVGGATTQSGANESMRIVGSLAVDELEDEGLEYQGILVLRPRAMVLKIVEVHHHAVEDPGRDLDPLPPSPYRDGGSQSGTWSAAVGPRAPPVRQRQR